MSAHTVDGGAYADSITGSNGNDLIDGGTEDQGNDTIISQGGYDTIYGRAGDDLINLEAGINAGNNLVHAGAGNDLIEVTLNELTPFDTINGDKGLDTLAIVGTAADFDMTNPGSNSGKAFDSIYNIETIAFGTTDNLYQISGSKNITLSNKVQSSGVLTIDARHSSGSGKLSVNANPFSSRSNLTFLGSDDKDVNAHFTGGSGNDTLTTGKIAEDDSDTLTGGLGEDTFNIIATNNNTIITDLGEGGSDTLTIANNAAGVIATVTNDYTTSTSTANNKSTASAVLNANNGVDIDMISATGKFGYTINGGEAGSTLQGSNFNDIITGGVGNDKITGNRGNDTVDGGAGADIINTGKGNGYVENAGNGADIIIHEEGNSVVIQNAGTDTVTVRATRAGVFIIATTGERTVDGSTSTGSLYMDGSAAGVNTVNYTGGSAGDTIIGGPGQEFLKGNGVNDTITGGLSADNINLGEGSNTVVFTNGITIDNISTFTADDIGAFSLAELEKDDMVEVNEELDFVNGSNMSVLSSDAINVQTINSSSTLRAETNVLSYTGSPLANGDALETALEVNGGIITTDGALEENDAFVIQYLDSDTNTYSFAIAHIEDDPVPSSTQISKWEVTDIAKTDLTTAFSTDQISFIP